MPVWARIEATVRRCGEGSDAVVMRGVKMWIAVAAAAGVTGCANGSSGLTSPSPLAVATPSVTSSCAVPETPRRLSADVTGGTVTLSWSAVGDAADYVVLVGSNPSSSETLLTNTPETYHAMADMPAGTHYARVHAHNWCGTSEPSEPIRFTVR
jgi:hypothetical protein